MKHRIIKICSSVVFGLFCIVGTALGQAPAQTSNVVASPSPSTTPASKHSTPQTRKRVRRAPRTQQPKATPLPSPTPEATPATVGSPSTEKPTPAATPEALTEDLPLVELPEEGRAQPAETEAAPTPEARLREQLKVVEQMVAQGLKQEALAELQLLAAEDRFDPQGFYNIANAFARLDATDAAITTYRKAIAQRKGRYSRASNNLGVILLRQGFWDQAYEAFLAALRVENFRYAEASYNLGRLYASRGEMDRALREWKRAVAVDPNHSAANRAIGNARSTGSSSPTSAPEPIPVRSASAPPKIESTSKTSVKQPSKTWAARPYTLKPEAQTFLQQGRTAHEQGRYEDALFNFRQVITRMGGYFSPANLEMSYSLIELRRTDEAIASLLLVAERDGARFPISYYHLGRLYELRGDLKLAEENYLRATQAYQNENAQFLLDLSSVREKRGDFTGALVAMENFVKRKEKQGQKPEWSDARLATLREKAAPAAHKQQ